MTVKSIVPYAMLGLLFATAAHASNSASVNRLPDGRTVVSNDHKTRTCKASEMPLATGGKTTVITTKGTKTYPNGVAICLDPADFGGAAIVTHENGEVVVKPAPPSGTPSS